MIDRVLWRMQGNDDTENAFQECEKQPDGTKHTLIRCEIPLVIEHTTLYVHAHYPKKMFSSAKLAHLEETGEKIRASLSQSEVHINDATLPLLKHWKHSGEEL